MSSFIRGYLLRGKIENRRRSGRPKKKPREYRKVERLVKVNRRDTLADITVKNQNNTNPVAKGTLQFHLHENGFKRRVTKKKLVIKEVNRKKRLSWCREKRTWSVENNWRKNHFF